MKPAPHIYITLAGALALLACLPAQACDQTQTLILAGNPDNTDAREALARACARAGQNGAALAHYDRLLASDSGNVDWLVGKSQALIALGRQREAIPYLERAREKSPAYEDVWRMEAAAREAAGDDERTDAYLRDAGRAFPSAAWPGEKRRALEEARLRERGTRVSLMAAYEDLSGGRPSWQSATLGIDKRLSAYRHLIGGLHSEERFDSRDEQFTLGWADRAGGGWSYGLTLDVAPDGEILPEWNVVAEAARALPRDMSLNLRARHADYANVDVDSLAVGVEKYFAPFRAAYTLTGSQPSGLEASFGHTLRLARDYGDENHVTLALGYGEEAETIAPGVVQVTQNRSVSINGLHWHDTAWGFTWEAGWYEQGDLYDRVRISLGLQHRF